MSVMTRCVPLVLAAMGGAVVVAAPAAAEPVDTGGSAKAVIDDLTAEGYDVEINWLTGYDTEPLSVCTVERINNPNGTVPGPGTLVTVYVDVACPNHPDD